MVSTCSSMLYEPWSLSVKGWPRQRVGMRTNERNTSESCMVGEGHTLDKVNSREMPQHQRTLNPCLEEGPEEMGKSHE